MKKISLLLCLLCYTFMSFAQADNWYIQVGVFEEKVPMHYFDQLGGEVFYARDSYGFHRYFKGSYTEEEKARKTSETYKALGYQCVLTSEAALNNDCVCNFIPSPKSLQNSMKSIFFDFDKSALRAASKKQLDELVDILNQNPSHTTKLRAHTDAKGSYTYNEDLSMRRANAAKRYLILKGISSYRIHTETFGEVDPIAKNELNDGRDTAQGRQFNRRVEIQILNDQGQVLNQMVDEIDVPTELINQG